MSAWICSLLMRRRARIIVLGLITSFSVALVLMVKLQSDAEQPVTKKKDVKAESPTLSTHTTTPGGHKMAILVPFRDRFEELLEFVPYMHNFLSKQGTSHEIYVINQVDDYRFNRASLINIGFLESGKDCDYVAMHDVDLVPVNPAITYPYPSTGVYHVASPDLHPLYHYRKFVGGILLLTRDAFISTNGMSNRYWGWGLEDDEFYVRMRHQALQIERPLGIKTGYKTFRHIHNRKKRQRDTAKHFNQSVELRHLDKITGASNIRYKVDSKVDITIKGAPAKIINVALDCDLKDTPWCLKPEYHTVYKAKGLIP
uniref:Beta-1,4-galactosyltransferase n=1 Tax=Crassostrea virginica TaxID=6565 RepID=A0A8B8E4V5_CRAVI|nr:beta-1,4-galactosyltransferase 7-like isoform X1 [Crassostrea virginica]